MSLKVRSLRHKLKEIANFLLTVSHPNYPKYAGLLSPGLIRGRKVVRANFISYRAYGASLTLQSAVGQF